MSAPNMSPKITLANWASQHLKALYESRTTSDFDAAFEAFFSTKLHATLNGSSLSRNAYKAQLSKEFLRESSILFKIQTEVVGPSTKSSSTQATDVGSVGLVYTANFSEAPLLDGHVVSSTLNMKIASVDLPIGPNGPGDVLDFRRVVSLDQVLFDRDGLINPGGPIIPSGPTNPGGPIIKPTPA